jgi:hypothetical protein
MGDFCKPNNRNCGLYYAKLALSVRYGTSILELAKNKYAIEVGTERDLVAVLETVRTATLNGELDNAMATASTKLRAAFGK